MLRDEQARRTLVRVVLDPRLLRLRGEPAHAEDVRHRRAGRRSSSSSTSRRRRRRRTPGSRRRSRARRRGQPGLAHELLVHDGTNACTSRRTGTRRSPRSTRPARRASTRSATSTKMRAATAKAARRRESTVHVTGRDPLYEAHGGGGGARACSLETLIGGIGALLILLFVFGTLPAVAAAARHRGRSSILTTFTLVWALTYVTDVSIIVQFLVALVGLGVAIDYSLLMIFRFREELRHGRGRRDRARRDDDPRRTLGDRLRLDRRDRPASAWCILPLPFIRSIGLGGMLIPLVCGARDDHADCRRCCCWLGPRINRLRVMPKRIVDRRPGRDGLLAPLGRLRRAAAGRDRRSPASRSSSCSLIPASQMNPSEARGRRTCPAAATPFAGPRRARRRRASAPAC